MSSKWCYYYDLSTAFSSTHLSVTFSQLSVCLSPSQALEKKNVELKQREEKVKGANSELCTKMREMIQELDQEKQEAAQRFGRYVCVLASLERE